MSSIPAMPNYYLVWDKFDIWIYYKIASINVMPSIQNIANFDTTFDKLNWLN